MLEVILWIIGIYFVIQVIKSFGKQHKQNGLLLLTGMIINLEKELASSRSARDELKDDIAMSLGGSFLLSELHSALFALLYTMYEKQNFSREILNNPAVIKTLESSAERIRVMLVNDLMPEKAE